MIPSSSPITIESSHRRSLLTPPSLTPPPLLLGLTSLFLLLCSFLFSAEAADDDQLAMGSLIPTASDFRSEIPSIISTISSATSGHLQYQVDSPDVERDDLKSATILSDGHLAIINVSFHENSNEQEKTDSEDDLELNDNSRTVSSSIVVDGHYALGFPLETVEGDLEEIVEEKKEVNDKVKKSDAEDGKFQANEGAQQPWVGWLELSKESMSKSRGTSFFSGIHRAMFLGASAVMVFASFRHPQLLRQLESVALQSSSKSLLKKPVIFLRAAEFNVSLLFHALASKLKASVRICPRRPIAAVKDSDDAADAAADASPSPHSNVFGADAPPPLSVKSREQTTPTMMLNGGSGVNGEVTFWGRCGRYSQWHGVVCLEKQFETSTTSSSRSSSSSTDSSSVTLTDYPQSSSSSSSDGRANSHQAAFHLWNLLYSASISLCLFLLLKLVGGSPSSMSLARLMSLTRRGDDEDIQFPLPPSEKDVEISLRRLARDALKAMPISRYQISPKRCPDLEPQMCPICLSNFSWNQKIRLLPCRHEFHTRCADPWLVDHRTCPLCKLNIVRHWALKQI